MRRFFDELGDERCQLITHVSADAADWIATVVAERCPNAVRCADPFHVVGWATDALDEVRRQAWNQMRGAAAKRRAGPSTGAARTLTRARYALWKNPENLTHNQRAKLDWIAKTDPQLYRAYLLKEGLRLAFQVKGEAGKQALDRWTSWARRCRIPAFVKLQRRIVKHRAAIDATLDHNLSNGLVESTNTKIRLLTRVAFGFHNPKRSPPSPCSRSAATAHPCPAGGSLSDPHIGSEGPIMRRRSRSFLTGTLPCPRLVRRSSS